MKKIEKMEEKRKVELQEIKRESCFSHIQNSHKRRFLEAFAFEAWTLAEAVKIANTGKTTHYRWMETDEEYKEAFRKAEEIRNDRLEDLAFQRASAIRNPSDTLLIFLLKGAKPHKYKERVAQEITGENGNPVQINVVFKSNYEENSKNSRK